MTPPLNISKRKTKKETKDVCVESSVGTHRLLVDTGPDRLMFLGAMRVTNNLLTSQIKVQSQYTEAC